VSVKQTLTYADPKFNLLTSERLSCFLHTGVACAAARASFAAIWLLFCLTARLTTPSGKGALAARPGARAGLMGNTGSCADAGESTASWAARGAEACSRLRDAELRERHSTSTDSTACGLAAIAGTGVLNRDHSVLLRIRCTGFTLPRITSPDYKAVFLFSFPYRPSCLQSTRKQFRYKIKITFP
jgi:hypothetical protein